MERAVPAGRHRRFAFGLPRIKTPEDAEAAIDLVMDGLAEGVLSLPEVAELLRLIERLLQMAANIGEMKRVRDLIARRPSAEPDQDAVQQAYAGVLAAAQQWEGQKEVEAEDVAAAALYFPVNHKNPSAAEGPPGTSPMADSPHAPATSAGSGPPQAVAA
jgi:hypothetical protein